MEMPIDATNGIKHFFSEEAFTKILGKTSHELRLLENLKKVGINLNPYQQLPINAHATTSSNTDKQADDNFDFKPAQKTFIRRKARCEPLVGKLQPEGSSSTVSSNNEKLHSSPEEKVSEFSLPISDKEHDDFASKFVKDREHASEEGNETPRSQTSETDSFISIGVIKNSDLEHKNEASVNTDGSGSSLHSADSVKEIRSDFLGIGSNDIEAGAVDNEISNVIPASFYRNVSDMSDQSSEHEVCVSHDTGAGTSTQESLNTAAKSCQISVQQQEPSGHWTGRGQKPEIGQTSTSTKQGVPEQPNATSEGRHKDFKKLDPVFFDSKDRSDKNKYEPMILKKKPRNRKSNLAHAEQKFFLEMLGRYGDYIDLDEKRTNPDFTKFQSILARVKQEQFGFQCYLKRTAKACHKDYQYIHPDVTKYVEAMYAVKRKRVLSYPRYYSMEQRVCLTGEPDSPPPTLRHVTPVLELGTVTKLVMPTIALGLPQPCTPTNFKKINELKPVVRNSYKGPYVWNKEVCSQDVNGEQLAVPRRCDVVMSASCVKHLADNQGKLCRFWEMPVTVREYLVTEGDKKTIHRVAFLDKPFTRLSELAPKEKNQLFQKHAIRAVAKRQQLRGFTFVGVKPVHEVERTAQLEDIQKELEQYETGLKEILEKQTQLKKPVAEDKELANKGKGEIGQKKMKGKMGKKLKSQGMFDLDPDEFDNLETFGMDNHSNLSRPKSSNIESKGLLSPKEKQEAVKMSEKETVLSSLSAKSGHLKQKNDDKEDLEKLKLELLGIKTKAKQDSAKSAPYFKQMNNTAAVTESFDKPLPQPHGFYQSNPSRVVINYGDNDGNDTITCNPNLAGNMMTPNDGESKHLDKELQEHRTLLAADTGKIQTGQIDHAKTFFKLDEDDCKTEAVSDNTHGISDALKDESKTEVNDSSTNKPSQSKEITAKVPLSAKMQQMTDIKSQLGLRSQSTEKKADIVKMGALSVSGDKQQRSVDKGQCLAASRTGSGAAVSTLASCQKEQDSAIRDRTPQSVRMSRSMAFTSDGDSDDSDDGGGLVIDLPSDMDDEGKVQKKSKVVTDVSKNKTADDHIDKSCDVMELETSSDLSTSKTEQDKNVGKEECEINAMETSGVNTRGAKRKSTGSLEIESPVAKRNLRSNGAKSEVLCQSNETIAASKIRKKVSLSGKNDKDSSTLERESVNSDCVGLGSATRRSTRLARSTLKDGTNGSDVYSRDHCKLEDHSEGHDEDMGNASNEESGEGLAEDQDAAMMPGREGRGQRRKASVTADRRSTNQRSLSVEGECSALSERVTRQSAGASNTTRDGPTEIPVKRRRGRPPKNKPSETNKDSTIESSNQAKDRVSDNVQTRSNVVYSGIHASENVRTRSKGRNSVSNIGTESRLKGRSTKMMPDDNIVNDQDDDTEDVSVVVSDIIEPESAESKSETGQVVDSKEHQDSSEDEGLSPIKRKAPIIDDDDKDLDADRFLIEEKSQHYDNGEGERGVKKQRGRPPRKSQQVTCDKEAKKIREMAEEMKRKVEAMKKERFGSEDGKDRASQARSDQKMDQTQAACKQKLEGYKTPNKIAQRAKTNNDNMHHVNSMSKSAPNINNIQKTECPIKQPVASPSVKSEEAAREQGGNQGIQDRSIGDHKPPSVTQEVTFGIDSVLQNSSVFRPRADINKGSIIDTVAAKHGMSHLALPVEENVVYHQWDLAGINILIRAKYHGFIPGRGLVHVSPKMEYQPFFGYEKDTVNEVCRNWISVLVRPNSSLLRARVNPFNSEIMKFDEIDYSNIIPHDSTFSMQKAFTDLHKVLSCVKELPTGQFLLRNNPRKSQVTIMKATGDTSSGVFDLHRHHASFTKTAPPTVVQWVPIDTHQLLPHHRKMGLVPCTYQPKDMVFTPGAKKKGKVKKKKKRRHQD